MESMGALLILAWLTPLAGAALAPSARLWWLPAVAALPALAAAVLVPTGDRLEVPWLLLGSVFELDETARIFLAFTSVLWLAAGIYGGESMRAGPHAGRFRVFFLLAMAGNLWLIVGQDLASYYMGFSLMGLASYGLVVHDGDRPALQAGKVYLVMTVFAELALFAALVLIVVHAGGLVPDRAELVGLSDLTIGLLLVGLAIKAGLVPVHVWLPLAHPAAPVPASAVLSGAMIKVALLGWLRFLPVGEAALTGWGLLLVFIGLLTLFFAIPIGLVQSNPKVILAYSSVSKMGLMTLTLGLILLEPDLAPAAILAISLFATHHALVKGGLFLGVGLRLHAGAQGLVLAGIVVLALSLAGIPFSSGAVAKYGIKPALAGTDWTWLATAVTLSTAATALLMARFLWVIWRLEPHPSPGHVLGGMAWGGLIALSLLFSLLLGTPAAWETDALPIGVAVALALPVALVAWRKPDLLRSGTDLVRPGDILGLVRTLLAVLGFSLRIFGHWWYRLLRAGASRLDALAAALGPAPEDPERGLRSWPNAGSAWLLITSLLLIASFWQLPDLNGLEQARVAAGVPAAATSGSEPPAVPAPESVSEPPIDAGLAGSAAPSTAIDRPTPVLQEEREAAPKEPELEVAKKQEPGADAPIPEGPVAQETTPEGAAAQAPTRKAPAPKEAAAQEPKPPEPARIPEPRTARAEGSLPLPGGPAEPESDLGGQSSEVLDTGDRPVDSQPPAPGAAVPADIRVAGRDPDFCDPGQRFIFAHPQVAEPLRLVVCVQEIGGPRRLLAPPLTNPLVELVQRHLRDLGYDPGPVDGLIGPRTRGAIRRFQRDQGSDSTGAIGFALLEGILSAASAAQDAIDATDR